MFKYFFLLMLCITTAGCVSVVEPSKPLKLMTDGTFGYYHENLEPDLILITLTPENYALLTEEKPVPIKGEIPPRYSDFLDQMKSKYGLKRVANWPLPEIDIFCVVFEVQDTKNRDAVVTSLNKESVIETAQIVQTFDVQAQNYNDPYLYLQHGIKSTQAINSHQWSRGKGVKIAVIDTGMDTSHPDLKFNIKTTKNFVDNDDAKFRTDTHGTAVGGIIGANVNNNIGIVGIAPDATLLAIKACWQFNPNDTRGRCNSLTLAKALDYSIQQKVDIINLSLTGPSDPILKRLILKALAQNIHVIGAAPLNKNKAFPVSIKGIIGVAMPDQKSQFISAPGRHILSIRPNKRYDFFDGSSFSTAHITGVAALILSLSPTLTPSELQILLQRTVNKKTGEVNTCQAIAVIRHLNGNELDNANCH